MAERITHFPTPPSEEDHKRAVDAMKPYLAAFQQAAAEQTAADFRTEEQMADCVLTFPDGTVVTLKVSDASAHGRGKLLLTFVGEPRVEKRIKRLEKPDGR
jgi:hypothetical protein